MIVDRWGGELYHISIVYTANTMTAFVLMNVMASKIHLSNITKFKNRSWRYNICLCRVVICN